VNRYVHVFAIILCASGAYAQDGGRGAEAPPAPVPRNLQVLPKGSSQQDVLAVMQQFTRGLGVACTYCHVEQTAPLLTVEEQQAAQAAAAANPQQAGRGRGRGRGRGGPQMDFASDDRRQKKIARAMLAMTNDINAKIEAAVHASTAQPREAVHVQCMTCHRGVTNPEQLSNLLRQTMLGKGEGAAVAQYRELRQRYLDTSAYDFREPVLLELGRESLATHKPDDAVAWLQLNVEFFPQSAASFVELAKAHVVKRDRDSAIADLTKALAIDPANADAKRQLRDLRK